tara:strand:+ start:329 stop:1309 length:981 start_codon:yes stop_codon:yes gene_type:complete
MAGIGNYKKGGKFTLRSGNTPSFKGMGSSPSKHMEQDESFPHKHGPQDEIIHDSPAKQGFDVGAMDEKTLNELKKIFPSIEKDVDLTKKEGLGPRAKNTVGPSPEMISKLKTYFTEKKVDEAQKHSGIKKDNKKKDPSRLELGGDVGVWGDGDSSPSKHRETWMFQSERKGVREHNRKHEEGEWDNDHKPIKKKKEKSPAKQTLSGKGNIFTKEGRTQRNINRLVKAKEEGKEKKVKRLTKRLKKRQRRTEHDLFQYVADKEAGIKNIYQASHDEHGKWDPDLEMKIRKERAKKKINKGRPGSPNKWAQFIPAAVSAIQALGNKKD